ncbi:DUF3992 domain-containing protein [Bacillus thuringiensis]|uniref:DUF3992 domain-containing protein n=1 Tax=Bacillus thuringiensis TaxID=1428 RepID=UPI0034574C10
MAQLGNCCEQQCCVNDAVCCDVLLAQGSTVTQTVWTNNTTAVINGTIMVENNGSATSPSANLVINGTPLTPPSPILPGECRAITVDNLSSVGLSATGGTVGTTATVKVSFSLNYKF